MIKAFIEEEGTSVVLESIASATTSSSTRIAYVECRAAISRAEREGRLDTRQAAQTVEDFDRSWPDLQVVEFTADIAKQAGDLTRAHRLRAGDAIHLASAAVLGEEDPGQITFGCWDARLWVAAKDLGYPMIPAAIPQLQ